MFLIVLFKYLLVIFSLIISRFIPYLGFFPYKERLSWYHVPDLINRLANFDGIHYLINAQEGYHAYEQAYFPLFPLLIRLLKNIFFGNTLVTGIVISNIFFLFALLFINKLLKILKIDTQTQRWIIIFLVFSPFSFFFNTVYTESLFLLLFALTFYFFVKNKFLGYLFSSIFLSLSRLIGTLFFVIPFVSFIKDRKIKNALMIAVPLIGLLIYMTFLYYSSGDAIKFLSSQPAFGANRSSHIVLPPQTLFRYFKIIFLSSLNYQYFISIIELIVYSSAIVIITIQLIKHYRLNETIMLSLDLFSLVNIVLPSLTGTLSSIPRYALMSFSLYFFFGSIKSLRIKSLLLFISLLLNILFFSLFLQGYFVA